MRLPHRACAAGLAMLFAGSAWSQTGMPGTIQKFHLQTCGVSQGRCVTIDAVESEGSQLKPILFLRDVRIAFQEKGQTNRIVAKDGYIDLSLNRAVFRVEEHRRVVEKIVLLGEVRIQTLKPGEWL